MIRAPKALRPLTRLPQATVAKRSASDVAVLPHSLKPVISYGPAGRSAVTGHVATVFGCTGFLGRYLVAKLAQVGTQVIVPYRDEDEKRHLRVMGDLGQIVPLEWDLRNENQIEECVRHSDIVYNLVGRDYETKNFSYSAVHTEGAEVIASVCRRVGVPRLVHVSHLNAAHDSLSEFYRVKARGEEHVMDVFPNATIVRPGPMFGHEDKLLNSMAVYPFLWKLNYGETRIRPVHVFDVAQALANIIVPKPEVPNLLVLPGPRTWTYESMLHLIELVTYNSPTRAPTIPKRIALFAARAAQLVWWPLLSPDEVIRRYIDDVGAGKDGEVNVEPVWDLLGVQPEELEDVAISYLRRYRSAANFAKPVYGRTPVHSHGSRSQAPEY